MTTTPVPVQFTQEQFEQMMQAWRGMSTMSGDGRNAATLSSSTGSKSSVKPVRPSVDFETTEGEWAVFIDEWERFKRMANLVETVGIRDNLRQCCSSSLNKRLFDLKSPATLNTATEEDLLAWIKDIAVKGVHKEVHRTHFVNLRNKQGESITAYLGRLKASAALCDFRVTC